MGSKKNVWDVLLAEDLARELPPFTFTMKHIGKLDATRASGFCFAYVKNDVLFYDQVETQPSDTERNTKPARFLLPDYVHQQLKDKRYTHWYFYDRQYLYPLIQCKVPVLFASFWFIRTDLPQHRTHSVFDPGVFNLRKKPLLAVRPSVVPWFDRDI